MTGDLQVKTTHSGPLFAVEVLSWTDGEGRKIEREVVRHPGAVLVVPVLNDSDVVMIRNYRVAVDERLLECPAGKLNPQEDPLKAAKRELEEETGYRAGRISTLGEFYTSPGFADELMHVFVADHLEFVGQRLEAGEDIQVEIVNADQTIEMIRNGSIRDGKTIAGLLMWRNGFEVKSE